MNSVNHSHAITAEGARTSADYVVVDDTGDFAYYASPDLIITDLEYVQEASCILDRAGNGHRLLLREDRTLCISPSLGPVDFHWLRQAWGDCQRRNQRAHPLHRRHMADLELLLAGLFEVLSLEGGDCRTDSPWTLEVDGEVTHPASLREVDGVLAGMEDLERATVHDPFGHGYRPVRHSGHRSLAPAGKTIHYVELSRRHQEPPGRH